MRRGVRTGTYSIVAWDPDTASGPEWGVAVASKFLAAGGLVPWARAGAGAMATQALANVSYGEAGLARLAEGAEAAAVLAELTGGDQDRDHRQVGLVDSRGRSASFTGRECIEWAGGRTGQGFCCQGNVLSRPEVIDAAASTFEAARGQLAARLLEALAAGEDAGGDRRGRQSAGLLVVREGGGYGGGGDRAVDLRVDDHGDPVAELRRLFDVHQFYFPRPEALRFVNIDEGLADEIRTLLQRVGYPAPAGRGYDAGLKEVLFTFVGMENLEERWSDDPRIERAVLDYLRQQAGEATR
jgi:uncharacterized Ntn-hydrolase superfamily protein